MLTKYVNNSNPAPSPTYEVTKQQNIFYYTTCPEGSAFIVHRRTKL